MAPNADFLFSLEQENLSSTPEAPDRVPMAMEQFLRIMAGLAPSLPGPGGFFNGYGRVYIDSGHIETAFAEAHSPYVLAQIIERQQQLVRRAREQLAARGVNLLLANNNHSGVLRRGCPVWGSHENYLVEQHPRSFTESVLPLLVTRIYAGAGDVEATTGNYLAAVRPLCMEEVTGGGTTGQRAIHSTCREEHHLGPNSRLYRYHLIVGDGHRSQFNLALQFGATALALKAAIHDRKLHSRLKKVTRFRNGNWVQLMQELNVLQKPGEDLRIDPVIVDVQRIYLEAAGRYVEKLDVIPDWVPKLLGDWEQTLIAFERLDRGWLAARLDAFAKYEFYSSVLDSEGISWSDLRGRPEMLAELSLLNHSFHNFCDLESVFAILEQDGLLRHRVGPVIPPGTEPESYVPECETRARPRARFIREHGGEDHYVMDWARVWDRKQNRIAGLEEPFATEYDEWTPIPMPEQARPRRFRHLREMLEFSDSVPF